MTEKKIKAIIILLVCAVTLSAQVSTRLSDFVSCAPLDIVVANNGSIQVLKGGAGQMYSPSAIPPNSNILNSLIVTIGNSEIGQQGPGNFGYIDHGWDGSVTGVSGNGSESDPWEITANLTSSTYLGLTVDITYSYVNGREFFDVSYIPSIPASNTDFVKIYHCIDTYLNGSDDGAAYTLGSAPYIFLGVEATTGGLYEGFIVGNRQWDHYSSENFSDMLFSPNSGSDLSDFLDADPNTDNGIAVQWDLGVVQGVQPEINYKLSFTSNIPLPLEVCGNGLDDNIDGRVDENYPAQVEENMLLWVKADQGFTAGSWQDLSPESNHGTNFNSPTQVNSINFNSAIDYNGSNYSTFPLPELQFDSGNNHIAFFLVYYPDNNNTSQGVFGNQEDGLNNFALVNSTLSDGSFNFYPEASFMGSEPKLLSIILDEEDNVSGSANSSRAYVNGDLELSFNFDENSDGGVDPNFHLGKSGSNASSLLFDGKIMECIIFYENDGSTAITELERSKLETYLALKYGISLPNDYVSNP